MGPERNCRCNTSLIHCQWGWQAPSFVHSSTFYSKFCVGTWNNEAAAKITWLPTQHKTPLLLQALQGHEHVQLGMNKNPCFLKAASQLGSSN
jgi:hypothetical protein